MSTLLSLYVLNAGHGRASGVLYVRLVNIVPGIQERHTDIYGHVCMGVFLGIGAPLMAARKPDSGDSAIRAAAKDGKPKFVGALRSAIWTSTDVFVWASFRA